MVDPVRRRDAVGRRRWWKAPPRLSVVIPVYNVEKYVAKCLDSVLAQSFRDLELIVVVDGATDRSAQIVETYARAHPRVHVVRQTNKGLGAARNAGVRHARGEFLTFVDSDDLLPSGAYETMMGTLTRTGSDFVVGTLKHVSGGRAEAGRLMRENHAVRREGVSVCEIPQILADVFAVNKIFRRAFWESASLRFPEGVRYEDQPTLTQAFLAADRIDVVPETVYLWQLRRGSTAITQTRHLYVDLHDRILTKRMSTREVMQARPQWRDLWYGKILPVDMWEYFRASLSAEDDYKELLRAAVTEFWNDETVPFSHTELPVQQRIMGWWVQVGAQDELRRFIKALDESARRLPLEIVGDGVACRLPEIQNPAHAPPARAYTLGPHELLLNARILHAQFDGSKLFLAGYALIRNVPTEGRQTLLWVRAVGPNGVSMQAAVRPRREPIATGDVGNPHQNYDDCGFECWLDVNDLVRLCPPRVGRPTTWEIRAERSVEGLRRVGGVSGYRPDGPSEGWRRVAQAVEVRLHNANSEIRLELRAVDEGLNRPAGAEGPR
jgi:glycosyltransferase involved in cell wall biosynthesis